MKNTATDKRVKLYKAVCGLIPGGSFMVEYMIDRIPDQRMERLYKYIDELNKRIEKLECKESLETFEFSLLAESAIIESTKAQSNNRLKWLALITLPSNIPPDEKEWEYRRKAIDILSSLSDGDIDCLIHYSTFEGQVKFEQKNNRNTFISYADRENNSDYELFIKNLSNHRIDVYRNALVSHGLISSVDKETEDDFKITEAGRMFIYIITGNYPR